MRTRLVVLLSSILILGLPGCFLFGDGDPGSFEVARSIDEQTVEGNLLGGLLGGLLGVSLDIDVDLDEETRARSTGPAQHVYLSELSLSITPTGVGALDQDDFSFLDSIEIFIESRAADTTLPRQRIAYRDTVADGADTFSLSVEVVDIREYIREGARLTASANGQTPTDDVTFDGYMILTVEVL